MYSIHPPKTRDQRVDHPRATASLSALNPNPPLRSAHPTAARQEVTTAKTDKVSDMEEDTNSHNATRQAASPSPPPPAPVPLTPGPRAAYLQKIFDQALARTLRANSFANFSGCFPTPAKHVPASLESVWRQLNAKLEESAVAEFEDILRERNAIGQLNELDRLVGEAKYRKENGQGEGDVAYVPSSFSPCRVKRRI